MVVPCTSINYMKLFAVGLGMVLLGLIHAR
jgi:hypothetical protein